MPVRRFALDAGDLPPGANVPDGTCRRNIEGAKCQRPLGVLPGLYRVAGPAASPAIWSLAAGAVVKL